MLWLSCVIIVETRFREKIGQNVGPIKAKSQLGLWQKFRFLLSEIPIAQGFSYTVTLL